MFLYLFFFKILLNPEYILQKSGIGQIVASFESASVTNILF